MKQSKETLKSRIATKMAYNAHRIPLFLFKPVMSRLVADKELNARLDNITAQFQKTGVSYTVSEMTAMPGWKEFDEARIPLETHAFMLFMVTMQMNEYEYISLLTLNYDVYLEPNQRTALHEAVAEVRNRTTEAERLSEEYRQFVQARASIFDTRPPYERPGNPAYGHKPDDGFTWSPDTFSAPLLDYIVVADYIDSHIAHRSQLWYDSVYVLRAVMYAMMHGIQNADMGISQEISISHTN